MTQGYLNRLRLFKLTPITIALIFSLIGCSKKDEFISDQPSEFMVLEPGKFVRYYLDSTRYVFFGQKDTLIQYQAKDVVDAQVTDALGRTGYRIIRYLRDVQSTSESDWRQNMSYLVVPTRESLEVVEGNFRQVKLRLPVTFGFQWKGNSFLGDNPYEPVYPFNNDQEMHLWDFTYDDVGAIEEFNNNSYEDVVTITHVADSVNVPITFPDGLALKNYWVEKYAKGVGLVYKEVSMWDYQPPAGGNPGYRTGFGIRMSIIDHN